MAGMLQLWPSSGRGCVNLTIRVPNRRPHMPAQAVCEMAGPQLPNSTSWELARGLRDAPLFPEPAFAASYQTPRGRRGSYGICSPPRASRAIQPIFFQAQPASFGSCPASILSSLLLRSRRYTRSCHPPASTPHSAAIFSPNSRVVGRAGLSAGSAPPNTFALSSRYSSVRRPRPRRRMDVGARHLGMPDGMLTRLVGERLYWKIVITFQISEPRGGKQQQQPHMRMPPPHFTILYMRAPCGGYPFQTSQSPQPALVPHAILLKLEELMQPFGAHPPPPDVIKKDHGLRVERAGTVHSLRTKIAAALDSQPGSFHWSSTCDSGLSNVHCTAGLPAGVPDHEGRVHFSKATLSKSLAPIAENLALHFALLGGRQQGDAGCEMTAFKVANLVAEADVPVSLAAECTWRSHVRGAACAG